jgi:hypothetical protein
MTTIIKDTPEFATPAPPTHPPHGQGPAIFGTPEKPFVTPVKRITNPSELSAFHRYFSSFLPPSPSPSLSSSVMFIFYLFFVYFCRSPSFRHLIGYIQRLCEVAEGKPNHPGNGSSPVCTLLYSLPYSIFIPSPSITQIPRIYNLRHIKANIYLLIYLLMKM